MEQAKLNERVDVTAAEREGLFAGAEDIISVVAVAGLMAAPTAAQRPIPTASDSKKRRSRPE